MDQNQPGDEPDARDEARRAIHRLFEDLTEGRPDAAGSRCDVAARWWLPVDGADDLLAPDACSRLARLLTSASTVRVTTVIVAPDGRRAVVELDAALGGSQEATAVTSVLHMNGQLLTGARTYVDVAAWEGAIA